MAGSRRRTWAVVAGVVVVALVLGVGAWLWLGRDDDPFAGADDAATSFAEAWSSGDLASLTFAGDTAGADVAARTEAITGALTPDDANRPTVVVTATEPDPDDDASGRATATVTWALAPGLDWTYDTSIPLVKQDGRWAVAWTPQVVHPELADGEALETGRVVAERGAILDADGSPLFTKRPVVRVGIATPKEGATTPTPADLTATVRQVADALAPEGIDAAALQQRVDAAPPDRFVEVVTLRRERYDEVRDRIHDLPGTSFQESTMLLAPSSSFARALLGTVGDATAEDIEQSGGALVAGQLVGHGGLQEAYQDRLAGVDGALVQTVPGADVDPSSSTSATGRVLFRAEPVRGRDIQVTLDRTTQDAAEAAVAGAALPTALVAVRPSTGELVAVANGGTGATSFNRAFEGRYPPGSTFKVVSTFALLGNGLSPDETVPCPETANVGGRTFVNAESHALGSVPFRTDFAESCNTAFVSLADRVDDAQLQSAATELGLADGYDLGVPAFGGEVPGGGDTVEHAATMIGQGRVLTSPLGMALVAGSVANGTTVAPLLVVDPATGAPLTPDGAAADGTAPDGTASDGAASDGTAGTATTTAAGTATTAAPDATSGPLDPQVVAQLQELMREVVVSGTATVLGPVPGEVHAKTGTAEYGTETPPRTHAWMIGYRGDLAFAVLVEDGGFGAVAAGPVAATFLAALP